MPKPSKQKTPAQIWDGIPAMLAEGLAGFASRDFCALECLANDPLYAKPDSQKISSCGRQKTYQRLRTKSKRISRGSK